MKRDRFLITLGAGLLPLSELAASTNTPSESQRIRLELADAWRISEKTTLITISQMPADLFEYKYTPEAMTFAEQWRHCCLFTVMQLSGRLGVPNPYENQKLPKVMTKEQVLDEIKKLYSHVQNVIQTVSDEKLLAGTDFGEGKIPGWRLLYAMENHIIHHRGQCMVYLRLKGITPEGYVGW
jgi:uncharacterized damage-inducible protein DinB